LDLLIDMSVLGTGLIPKSLGDLKRVDAQVMPPGYFVTGLMQLLMMVATKRDSKLIADFKA
jgi:hypothetical protein